MHIQTKATASLQESSQNLDVRCSLGTFLRSRWCHGHAVQRERPIRKGWSWPCTMNKEYKPHWKKKGSKTAGVNKMNETAALWFFIQWLFPYYAAFDRVPYFTSTSRLSRTKALQAARTAPRAAYPPAVGKLWSITRFWNLAQLLLHGKPRFLQERTLGISESPQINGKVSFWQKLEKLHLTAVLYFASTASKESTAMLCKICKLGVLMLALQSR